MKSKSKSSSSNARPANFASAILIKRVRKSASARRSGSSGRKCASVMLRKAPLQKRLKTNGKMLSMRKPKNELSMSSFLMTQIVQLR